MRYTAWKRFYTQIIADFNYSIAKDRDAAHVLSELLANKNCCSLSDLKKLLHEKIVIVFGDASTLEKMLETYNFSGQTLIAADNATSVLMRNHILPHIIVTDLDGVIKHQLQANRRGSIVLIHAHGDNMGQLKKYVPKFSGRLLGTTQTEPFNGIYNFGGFTDGDRAVCLAAHFDARKIVLIGFDFEHVNTKKKVDIGAKRRKLAWAKKIIFSLKSPEILIYD